MKFYDTAELALRNLRQSMLRNVLTTLGVAVGIASLVAFLSLGIGLQSMFSKRLGSSGLFDTIIVSSRREIRIDGGRRQTTSDRAQARALDEPARAEIQKLPNVIEVFPEIRFLTELRFADKPFVTGVFGLPHSARDNEAFEGMKGAFFSSPEASEVILHIDFARDVDQNTDNLLGKELVVRYAERQALAGGTADGEDVGYSVVRREQPLRIVGIVESEPYGGFRGMRGGVYIPIQLAERLNVVQASDLRSVTRDTADPGERTYTSLTVRTTGAAQVPSVQAAIKKLGFRAFSLQDATRNLQRFFAVLDLFLGIFGSLALAVASLGIINTLVMAILERRREIGVMKAIGASDRDVKGLFFAEAGLIGAVGGVSGVLLGWAIGRAINFGTAIYLRRQDLPPEDVWLVPWWLVLAAVGISIGVTLVAGLYPASRAAKLDPVQALRYE